MAKKKKTKKTAQSKTKRQKKTVTPLFQRKSAENSMDIVKLILQDHKPLKQLIETLKDEDADTDEKMKVFDEFAPLLVAHAKPEEQTLYKAMKEESELRAQGLEGEVEHVLADQLLEEIKRTTDEDEWCAKVKVLAEIVEHHIEEEEESLLPDYKKESEPEQREELGQQFLALKEELESRGSDDAPHEAELEEEAS